MIIVMEEDAAQEAEAVISFLVDSGFDVHQSSGQTRSIIGVVGEVTEEHIAVVRDLPGVAEVVSVSEPCRLASRRFRREATVVEGDWGSIGGDRPWIGIEPVGFEVPSRDAEGGPPSAQLRYEVAAGRPFDAAVTRSNIAYERMGALACVTLHPQPDQPMIFVARQPTWGMSPWLRAAEKQLARGETAVVLLETGGEYPSGIRTLEIGTIPRAKQRSHLPVVVDVPTVAQRSRYCAAVATAAIAAGADGIILRAWVGTEGTLPRVPATLPWREAVHLAEVVRNVSAAARG